MVPCFPLLGLTPSGLFMGLSSTLIYTSELILCSTICVPSATRHNIQQRDSFGNQRFLKGGINYTRDKSAILGNNYTRNKNGFPDALFILGIAIPGISLLL